METWTVEDHLDIDIDDLRRAGLHLIGGDVAFTAGEGPAHLEVTRITGHPVMVTLAGGALEVRCETSGWWPFRNHHDCQSAVALVGPAATELRVDTVSAEAVVAGLGGPLDVRAVSGGVVLDALTGPVHLKTVSGAVEARGLASEFEVTTVSGDVTVVGARCPLIRAKSVSGAVTLDSALGPGGVYDFTSVSGTVCLRLPDDTSADVEVVSVSGQFDCAFDGVGLDNRPGRRKASGRIGAGGSDVRIKTTSGNVAVLASRAA